MTYTSVEDISDKFQHAMTLYPKFRNKLIKRAKFRHIKGDISPRQFHILFCLKCSKYRTVTELAELMGISKSTLSIVMGKLIKKGYVIKTYPDGDMDKRRVYFNLSEDGQKVFEIVKKSEMEEFKYMYSNFSEEGKENIRKAFEYLYKVVYNSRVLDFIELMSEEYNDETEAMANKAFLFMIDFIRSNKIIYIGSEGIVSKDISSLTNNQINLLITIEFFKYDTISKLENYLNSSGSTVSITVSKLVEKGYLYKKYPNEGEDGRVMYIHLTEKGKNALSEINEFIMHGINSYVKSLSEEKREYLNTALDYILESFNSLNSNFYKEDILL